MAFSGPQAQDIFLINSSQYKLGWQLWEIESDFQMVWAASLWPLSEDSRFYTYWRWVLPMLSNSTTARNYLLDDANFLSLLFETTFVPLSPSKIHVMEMLASTRALLSLSSRFHSKQQVSQFWSNNYLQWSADQWFMWQKNSLVFLNIFAGFVTGKKWEIFSS